MYETNVDVRTIFNRIARQVFYKLYVVFDFKSQFGISQKISPYQISTILSDYMISMENHVMWNQMLATTIDNILLYSYKQFFCMNPDCCGIHVDRKSLFNFVINFNRLKLEFHLALLTNNTLLTEASQIKRIMLYPMWNWLDIHLPNSCFFFIPYEYILFFCFFF